MSKKTIWITGGSTGIGKALAIKFASKGWNVAISARRAELLNELSNSYENISSFPLDVTDKEKCKELFNEIKNKYENIDICFFSTGTWDPKKEKDIDVAQMEEVFKVNFFGTVNYNRVEMTVGRDFLLKGYDNGLINLFVYPIMEINDMPSSEYKKNFAYKNI